MMSSPASRRRTASMWTAQAPAPRPAMRSTSGEKRTFVSASNPMASVADRRPGRPAWVVDPEEVTARTTIGADRDHLDRTPRRLLGEAIAALGKRRKGVGSKAAALVKQRIRQKLVMKARRRHGLPRREAEIE